jgi:cyclohexadieny/prephenate dehydrogenase
MSGTILFRRVCLIGLGLIGSSLARRMRRDGLAGELVGVAKSRASRDKALDLGLVDRVYEDPAKAVADADLVMVCTPLGAYAELAETMCPHLAAGATLSDVGSVKQAVIRDLGPLVPEGVHLVPGHPVAGTEHSGPEAGFPELFDGRWCLLTPPPGTDQDAVDRVAALWRACGMRVEIMEPGHHDKVLAITSHLPHLIAYTIVGTATDLEESLRAEVIKFSAGGFRDFTRIAASDPVMWRDVFLNNREAVLEMLQRFTEDLTALQRAAPSSRPARPARSSPWNRRRLRRRQSRSLRPADRRKRHDGERPGEDPLIAQAERQLGIVAVAVLALGHHRKCYARHGRVLVGHGAALRQRGQGVAEVADARHQLRCGLQRLVEGENAAAGYLKGSPADGAVADLHQPAAVAPPRQRLGQGHRLQPAVHPGLERDALDLAAERRRRARWQSHPLHAAINPEPG